MATQAFRTLANKDKHTVGNLVSSHDYIQDVPYGALLSEDVDNYHLVETAYNAEGQLTAKYLTDSKKEAFLIASQEYQFLNEGIIQFFNGVGERGRLVIPTRGLRFDSSAYALSVVTSIKAGQSAHYDTTAKKFLIHDGTHANFATASVKLEVTSSEDNLEYTLGAPMVRFAVK